MIRRTLEELNLIDDYLMSSIASDPIVGEACCKKILSVLLQRDIGRVHVYTQTIIPGDETDLRGIRMDVEVKELTGPEGKETVANIYDIEPHTKNDLNFPRHNRFYQAKIDGHHLKSGENDFDRLPNLYVITITNFDVFDKDYMMYSFRNRCDEIPELEYNDGLCFVYFNTKGKKGGSQAIKNMLNYIQKSVTENVADEATSEIATYVKHVKSDPAVKEGIMTLGYYLDQEREEGIEIGSFNTKINDILELLEDLGPVSDDVKRRLEGIKDLDELSRLHKVAARSKNIEEFERELPKKSANDLSDIQQA